MEPMDAGGLS